MKNIILGLTVLGAVSAWAQGPANSSSDGMTGSQGYQMPNSSPTAPGSVSSGTLDPNNINRNNPRLQRTTPGIEQEPRTSKNSTTGDAYNNLRDYNLYNKQPGRQDSESSSTNH